MSTMRRALYVLFALFGALADASAQGAPAGDKLVFIVRHAEKASATDQDPSLSEAGRERASALYAALRDVPVSAVVATPRKRTTETAAPLTAVLHLAPIIIPFGASTPEHAAAVAAAVRAVAGPAVLVVGHSNTVNAIIAALGGPAMPDLCDAAYANLYVVRLPAAGKPTLVRAQFGAPDHAEASVCAGMTVR